MISDEERREVAAKLRGEALAWSESFPETQLDMDEVDAIFYELVRFAGISGVTYPELIYTRFADLVDRETCRNVYDGDAMGACDNGFECSVCGNRVEDYEGYAVTGEFDYCSKCGRKVER